MVIMDWFWNLSNLFKLEISQSKHMIIFISNSNEINNYFLVIVTKNRKQKVNRINIEKKTI